MKNGSFWSWSLGVGLATLPLIGGCLRTTPPPANLTTDEATVIESDPGITFTAVTNAGSGEAFAPADPEVAPVKTLPGEFALPPNVHPGKPLTDLIRLAQAGADEGVMLAFVTNSPNTFNPRAEDIIYLNDIGVPNGVVTALLQRDQKLKGVAGTAGNTTAPLIIIGTNAPAPYAAAPTPYPSAPAPYGYQTPGVPTEPPPAPPEEYATEPMPGPIEEAPPPDFYDSLAPYGSWVDVSGYGYCWQPAVCGPNPGWQPYFDGGRWAYTQCGWYWMSDYSWGWAPFHYGRWFHHDRWGWCWQPGHTWGPSWVCWRHNDTHCGWAPLPPGVHFTPGGGLSDHHHLVAHLSPVHFRFVEWRHFADHDLSHHGLSREQTGRVYATTTVSTRIVASGGRVSNEGLAPERVAVATHMPVTRVTLRDARPTTITAGATVDRLNPTTRTLSIYRPSAASVRPSTTIGSGMGQRAPATASAATGTPGAASVPAAPARAVPGQRTSSQSHWSAARTSEWPAQSQRPQETPRAETPASTAASPGQRLNIPPSYWAGSKYYTTPGSAGADHWRENTRNRTARPDDTASSGPQWYNPGVVERPQRDSTSSAASERHHREAVQEERPHREAVQVERPHHESAPVERPTHVQPAESHASHSAPPPAPASAPSHSSDHSDSSSSSSSHSGRR